jgi:hypothetical protein
MPTVLSYTNAFPGIPFPNHLTGQAKPQSYRYPGAVQPQGSSTVLTYANGFPGIAFPNHLTGQAHPQSFLSPGAVQSQVASIPPVITYDESGLTIFKPRPNRWGHP